MEEYLRMEVAKEKDARNRIVDPTVPSPHPLCTQCPVIKIVNKINNSLKIMCSFVFLID